MPILASGQLSHCPAFWTSSPAPMPAGVSSSVLPLALKSTVGGDVPSHDPWASSPTCCGWLGVRVVEGHLSLSYATPHQTSGSARSVFTLYRLAYPQPIKPGPALQCFLGKVRARSSMQLERGEASSLLSCLQGQLSHDV